MFALLMVAMMVPVQVTIVALYKIHDDARSD